MDRYWFLTSTTYGTWLPGDERGFVGETRDAFGIKWLNNLPGSPYNEPNPRLLAFAASQLKGPPIRLVKLQVDVLLAQFQETATHRGWLLIAVAIMCSHFHAVLGVPGDPDPEDLLRDLKAYGSRALNRRWGKPKSETWWTDSGSKRKLPDEGSILGAVQYVREQPSPLVIWTRENGLEVG